MIVPPSHGSRVPLSTGSSSSTLLSHKSSAVGLLNAKSSPHEITMSSSIPIISGAVVSRIRKVACASDELPHSSVAVNVTTVVPSQLKLGPVKSVVKLTVEQSSVAAPPLPLVFNHAWMLSAKFGSEHSNVTSVGCVVNTGAVVSSIVIVPTHVVA